LSNRRNDDDDDDGRVMQLTVVLSITATAGTAAAVYVKLTVPLIDYVVTPTPTS